MLSAESNRSKQVLALVAFAIIFALIAGYFYGANRPRPLTTLADFSELTLGMSDSSVVERFGPGVYVDEMPAAAGMILVSLNRSEGSLPVHCRRYRPLPTSNFEKQQAQYGTPIEAVACFSKDELFAVVTDRPAPETLSLPGNERLRVPFLNPRPPAK